jgi:hypothetical protein
MQTPEPPPWRATRAAVARHAGGVHWRALLAPCAARTAAAALCGSARVRSHMAIWLRGDMGGVTRSLKDDAALVHSKNKDGWQPLHQAAFR